MLLSGLYVSLLFGAGLSLIRSDFHGISEEEWLELEQEDWVKHTDYLRGKERCSSVCSVNPNYPLSSVVKLGDISYYVQPGSAVSISINSTNIYIYEPNTTPPVLRTLSPRLYPHDCHQGQAPPGHPHHKLLAERENQ